jgi:predicted NBD/HSP70 family sugar kinase
MKKYLALDVGGSSIKYVLIDRTLAIFDKGKVATPLDSLSSFVSVIGRLYDQYEDIIDGIAISMPGVIDPKKGYCYSGGSLSYIRNVDIISILKERCHTNITVGNNAKCAANAEVGFGCLQDVDDGVVIILGSGIGGCLVKDKKVHTGKHFSAGEFSYIKTNIDNYNDFNNLWYGRNGAVGLLHRYQSEMGTTEKVTGVEIFETMNNGSEKALRALDKFTLDLAIQIYNLQVIFDPEKVAIGGKIAKQSIFFRYLLKNIKIVIEKNQIPIPTPHIVQCHFKDNAKLIGAFYQHIITYGEE